MERREGKTGGRTEKGGLMARALAEEGQTGDKKKENEKTRGAERINYRSAK